MFQMYYTYLFWQRERKERIKNQNIEWDILVHVFVNTIVSISYFSSCNKLSVKSCQYYDKHVTCIDNVWMIFCMIESNNRFFLTMITV